MASFPGQTGRATGPPLPNPVTGLVLTVVGAGEIDLAWVPVTGPPATYTVFRAGVAIASGVVGGAYRDLTVAAATAYTYQVVAVNVNGSGLPSAQASGTTPPAQVQGLVASTLGSSSIGLTWTATTGASTYTVFRGASVVGTVSGTSFTDTALTSSTLYTYTVAANGSGGQGAPSSPASATTGASGATGAGAVANLTLINQGGPSNGGFPPPSASWQRQTLQWGAATPGAASITGYVVRRNKNKTGFVDLATVSAAVPVGGLFTYEDDTATNSYNPGNVGQGVTTTAAVPTDVYDYDVVALDSNGVRGLSSTQLTFNRFLAGFAPAWNASQAYAVGQIASLSGVNYYCTTANTNSAPPNANWFTLVGGDLYTGIGDLSFGQANGFPIFNDTAGAPTAGGFDIACHGTGTGNNALQRPAGSPACWIYDFECGAFNFCEFDIKITNASQAMNYQIRSRGPGGAEPVTFAQVNLSAYANLVVNQWTHVRIPLADLMMGVTSFTGSIAGNTLTVTAILSGPGLDSNTIITSPDGAVPSGCWISSPAAQNGPGTYTLTGPGLPATVTSRTMTGNRSCLYKDKIGDSNGINAPYYFQNMVYTRNAAPTKYVRNNGVSPDGTPTYTTWQAAINAYALNDIIEGLPDTFGTAQTFNTGAASVMNFGATDFTGGVNAKLTCRFRAGESFRLTCANAVTISAAGAKGFEINFNGANGVPATVKIGDSDTSWSQAHPLLSGTSPQHQILFTNGTSRFRLIGNTSSLIYGASQYSCSQIDSSCRTYFVKDLFFFLGGTNNNTTGSGAQVLCDLVDFEGDTVLMQNVHANLGGHDALSCQATHCILDSCSMDEYWTPQATGLPGSRCSSFDPNILVTGSGGHLKTSGPWGYLCLHNCNWNDGGAWAASQQVNGSKLDGLHVICRGGFWADITQSHAITLQYFGGDGSASGSNGAQSCSYVKMYNNTMINVAGVLRVSDALEVPASQIVAPTDMEGFGFQNNLLMRIIDTANAAFSSLILWQMGGGFGPPQGGTPLNRAAGGTWRNSFKGGRVEGNCVSFNTATATAKELTLQGTGGGAAQIDSPLAGWSSVDPGSGHPNVTNNTIVTEGSGTNRIDLINAGTAPGRSRTGVSPAPTSTIGLKDRPPLCLVTANSSGTAVSVDDAGYFVAGWLPVDPLFPEFAAYNDTVFIGTTAASAVAFKLSSIAYNAGGSGTLNGPNALAVTTGMGVWPGGFDGRRPWSDVGAIQS